MSKSNGRNQVKSNATPSFEEMFAQLQAVVQKLSDGNLSLQEALTQYEEGMTLAESCGRLLEGAELRVRQISDSALQVGATTSFESRGPGLQQTDDITDLEDEDDVISFEVIETLERVTIDEIRPGPRPPKPEASRRSVQDLDPLFGEDD